MPLHEYECKICGEVVELLLWSGEEPDAPCASCGGDELVKLLSTFAASGGATPGPAACAPGRAGG